MARVHGRKGQIQIGNASPLAVIGSLSGWSISFTRDTVDVTSFGDTNKTYLSGLPDVTGSFEGTFDTLYMRSLHDEAASTDGTVIRVTPSTDYPTFYYTGPAFLDFSVTGNVGDAVKISGTFKAAGAWTQQVDGSPVEE